MSTSTAEITGANSTTTWQAARLHLIHQKMSSPIPTASETKPIAYAHRQHATKYKATTPKPMLTCQESSTNHMHGFPGHKADRAHTNRMTIAVTVMPIAAQNQIWA